MKGYRGLTPRQEFMCFYNKHGVPFYLDTCEDHYVMWLTPFMALVFERYGEQKLLGYVLK